MEGGNPTSIPYVRTKSGVVLPFFFKSQYQTFLGHILPKEPDERYGFSLEEKNVHNVRAVSKESA